MWCGLVSCSNRVGCCRYESELEVGVFCITGLLLFRIRDVAFPNLSLIWRRIYCVCLFLSVMETLSKLWAGGWN